MQVTYWGVRGSIPVPGPETSRYGGNSSCVSVDSPGAPPVVLDAGTGARALGQALARRGVREVYLLFSHFHMDHVFGFPFFAPLYTPNTQIHVVVPAHSEHEAEDKLGRYLNGIYHPVRLRDVRHKLHFHPIRPGAEFEVGPYRVRSIGLSHPGGATGYRLDRDGQSFAYLTDTAPLAKPGEGVLAGKALPGLERRVIEAIEGATYAAMDTMFSREEYLEKMTWGHSYPEYGVALCEAASVGHLSLFHHAPEASDASLDALAARWASHDGMDVTLAVEGKTVNLEALKSV